MNQKTGDRIVILRKHLGKKQKDFARELGLTNAAISAIELGKVPLTEANARLISLVYSANEQWLRHGTGDMLKSPVWAGDDDENRLLSMFRRLTAETQAAILKIIEKMQKAPENGPD